MQKLRSDMDIGYNIQKARRKKKLTQEMTIAKMQLLGFDMSRSTYSKIEANTRCIYVSELVAFKKIFGVEYNDFFDGLEIGEDE